MPASRSRTERWRESLDQISQRGGGLELTIDRDQGPAQADVPAVAGQDLVWRVRLFGTTDDEIQVEQPSAMGQAIRLDPGTRVIVGMAIGQNRWMFKTTILSVQPATGRGPALVRLQMPTHVERCQRRNFYRMSTAELQLPKVQCWPLLDPTSVMAAEVANRAQIMDLLSGTAHAGAASAPEAEPMVLPEVGPPFRGKLVNIGGGGAGLVVERGESTGPDRSRLLWLRLNLTPQIPAPIAMTARIAHMHLDSGQNLYLGLAFDFSFHPAHREFVVGQICRYVLTDQHKQAGRRAG